MARHIEDDHSSALWRWAQYVPVLRAHLYHVPNGGRRNAKEAARFKGMGVRAGVSDYHLPVPRGTWHGLWIELKTPEPYPYRVTAAQQEWLERMRHQGMAAFVCRGWLEAKAALEWYLAQPEPQIMAFEGPQLWEDWAA